MMSPAQTPASSAEVAQHRQHATVGLFRCRRAQLAEDHGDVLLDRAHGYVEEMRDRCGRAAIVIRDRTSRSRSVRDARVMKRASPCNMLNMSTHSLRDLRGQLGSIVREVAASGEEAIITDSGTEVAVIISMTDYERLHEHADVADTLRLRRMRAEGFFPTPLAEMMDDLGISADEVFAS